MTASRQSKGRKIASLLYVGIALFIAGSMLIWPQETYVGARYGLELWAMVLVPSLFPFFIMSEILLNLGIVHALGILLEPVMRPLFNLPGTASFVVAMGFTSGFPMGAVLTRRLCEEKECTKEEAERVVSFTNNSSPLFILVAVSVGMFNNPLLGIILALSHYLSNIAIGIILGYFSPRPLEFRLPNEHIILKSLRVLIYAQNKRKPWGKLFGDSIRLGINNITLIGGFVIIYSVLIRILQVTGLLSVLSQAFAFILTLLRFSPEAGRALAVGFFEMTLGLKELSAIPMPLVKQAVLASILLGWSGLSIQSQVTSVLSGSVVKPGLYFRSRFLQGVISALCAYFLVLTSSLWSSVFTVPAAVPAIKNNLFLVSWSYFSNTFQVFIITFCLLTTLSLMLAVISTLGRLIRRRIN